ncbi:DAK2 domain-containing protein [Devosia rhodophyticola]|uniref:DAK2 domain-containing protein n=1 Tax=Devosia rhodophyticola TaxID=3026423 RepID=A0ABY7Z0R7_9HYPH|nr:DAK2 domain-containing protein [Devosia rhodophyticola]WDR07233.1 DAK2 domain-containing protein [Devosia rhodophyticola]
MAITIETLTIAIVRADQSMTGLTDVLNAADAKLGDGDTGTMLARLLRTFAAVDTRAAPDLGAAFMALAKAGAASTGSSLGTLVITAMMTAGKATMGQTELSWDQLGALTAAVRDAAMTRGKAELGAKTIIDGLDALARQIEGLDEPTVIAQAGSAAMVQVLADFRDRPSAVGRARMFADKSIGLDDPGMLALAEIIYAIAGERRPVHD